MFDDRVTDNELYAERLRREAMALRAADGDPFLTTALASAVRVKLNAAWNDLVESIWWFPDSDLPDNWTSVGTLFADTVEYRLERSLGRAGVRPARIVQGTICSAEMALSLLEAEHEVLVREHARVTEGLEAGGATDMDGVFPDTATGPEEFRRKVNAIFEAHGVAFSLTANSRIISRQSEVMHDSVVTPVLYLLHNQPRFSAAEAAYSKALAEIRAGDGGDAITDAAVALQETLKTLGHPGNSLGKQLQAAKKAGLFGETDARMTDAMSHIGGWVNDRRNAGEAHTGIPDVTLNDAWLAVHTAGALIIYLASQDHDATQP